MQPTASEIEQEKEALRDLRRRSVAQLPSIDPDLPIQTSPATVYGEQDDDFTIGGDPSHLFWVPADVHPELAPGEFREFLKEQATLVRTKSNASSSGEGGVSRRKSHLSRQYRPGSGGEIDQDVKVKPRRSSTYGRAGAGLNITLEDLQQIEDAASSGDPDTLRKVLRRSMSMGAGVPYVEETSEDPNAPIPLVHRPSGPGQIVRRAARTKIRKPGTAGGSLSFHTQRRGSTGSVAKDFADAPPLPLPSKNDQPPRLELDIKDDRPLSFSEESSIYDSYSYDTHEYDTGPDTPATSHTHITPTAVPSVQPERAFSVIKPQPSAPSIPLHQPIPQPSTPPHLNVPPPPRLHRTPSPPEASTSASPSGRPQTAPAQITIPHKKDKEKRGPLFSFGSKKGKSGEKIKEREQREAEKDREKKEKEEKPDGFLSSLFSSRKKPSPPNTQVSPVSPGDERSAARGHLGATGSLGSRSPSPSSIPIMNYSRYPIHVERAVYRLSHIKLANPRRALLEQVLISNLMFWYLGVINKTGAQGQQNNANAAQGAAGQQQAQTQKEGSEREDQVTEQRQAASAQPVAQNQQPAPEPQPQQQQQEPQPQQQQQRPTKPTTRRTSLTKRDRDPAARDGGGRRAEMPVKAVSYEMQARNLSMTMDGDYEGEYDSRGRGGGGGGRQRQQQQQRDQQVEKMWSDYNAANSGRPRDGGDLEGSFYYEPPTSSSSSSAHQRSGGESDLTPSSGSSSSGYGGYPNSAGEGRNGLPPGAMMPLEHTPIPDSKSSSSHGHSQYDYREYERERERDRGDRGDGEWGVGYQYSSQGGSNPVSEARGGAQTLSPSRSGKRPGNGNRVKSPTSPGGDQLPISMSNSTSFGESLSAGSNRSKSPPPAIRMPSAPAGNKLQGRSLSASALPVQQQQQQVLAAKEREATRLRKKSGPSSPSHGLGHGRGVPMGQIGQGQNSADQDEDVPLALWQERHRKR